MVGHHVEQQKSMGYIKHNAIIVTSWEPVAVEQARAKSEELGMVVSAVVKSRVNDYGSILVAPDGSKEGWEDSAAGDAQRAALRAWLNSQRYEDGSSSIEWCEVSYGSDDAGAEIVNHGWSAVMPNESSSAMPPKGDSK
jgi:hypothetical protein